MPQHNAAAADEVRPDEALGTLVAGHEIALCRVDGQVYAIANICPHGQALLSDGYLDGHELECPLHQGRVDVRSGAPMCPPLAQPVRCYPVKIEAGRVWVEVD